MAEKKGRPVTIKGVIYEDDVSVGKNDTKSTDIYGNKEGERAAFDSVAKDTVGSEVTSQATQGGIQAVVAHVQTQASNIGMSGLIAIGGGGAFQVEHMIDHGGQAVDKATPMIVELIETGTIQESIPVGHSKHGQDIPKVNSFLGMKVGDAKKEADAEKAKSEEQKAIEQAIQDAASPPDPSKSEKDGSMTSLKEQDRSMT